jgi:SAM-dependent methyltransferase
MARSLRSGRRSRLRDTGRVVHWEHVYRTKGARQVSWYQEEPSVSLALIEELEVRPDAAVLDVGGGASRLAARLLEHGFGDVSVLDVSARALALARADLGPAADRVRWLEQDVLRFQPQRRYGLWHDRAVFHFLVETADRASYLEALDAGLGDDGVVIVAAFADDGPTTCSGLPVARYDPDGLAAQFGAIGPPLRVRRELHRTPSGAIQPFTWLALRRRG